VREHARSLSLSLSARLLSSDDSGLYYGARLAQARTDTDNQGGAQRGERNTVVSSEMLFPVESSEDNSFRKTHMAMHTRVPQKNGGNSIGAGDEVGGVEGGGGKWQQEASNIEYVIHMDKACHTNE